MSEAALNQYPDPRSVSAPSRAAGWPFAAPAAPDGINGDVVRRICDLRRKREECFNTKLFGDPTWEMLLRLYGAHLDGSRMSISRLTRTTRVALTTVLRRLAILEKEGLVTRSEDPFDARRVFVALSLAGAEAMDRCFADSGNRAQFF